MRAWTHCCHWNVYTLLKTQTQVCKECMDLPNPRNCIQFILQVVKQRTLFWLIQCLLQLHYLRLCLSSGGSRLMEG